MVVNTDKEIIARVGKKVAGEEDNRPSVKVKDIHTGYNLDQFVKLYGEETVLNGFLSFRRIAIQGAMRTAYVSAKGDPAAKVKAAIEAGNKKMADLTAKLPGSGGIRSPEQALEALQAQGVKVSKDIKDILQKLFG